MYAFPGSLFYPSNIPTPGSMNRLFRDFFRKFAGVILEVYGTICRVSWGCLGDSLEVFGAHLGEGIGGKRGHIDYLK